MTGTISNLFPAPLWDIMGDYMGEAERTVHLDQLLDESVKSDPFKTKVQAEYNRNLCLFWDALRCITTYTTDHTHFFSKLSTTVTHYSDLLEPADVIFCQNSIVAPAALPPTPETARHIRRVLENPQLQKYLFPFLERLNYSLHSSLLVKEISYFPNLKEISLYQPILSGGYGGFLTPLDLRALPGLQTLHIEHTNVTDEDLQLSHTIRIESKWTLGSEYSVKEFSPPLTTLNGWIDFIWNIPHKLCQLFERFFNWLCYLC